MQEVKCPFSFIMDEAPPLEFFSEIHKIIDGIYAETHKTTSMLREKKDTPWALFLGKSKYFGVLRKKRIILSKVRIEMIFMLNLKDR